MSQVLPDVLTQGLAVVFCGTAAGTASARAGAYYAGPGNKFYRTLHEVGLTPRPLAPAEFHTLPRFGIGLTDLAKRVHGGDAGLVAGDFDRAGLQDRIERYAPGIVCFNGKKAAQRFLELKRLSYGWAPSSPWLRTRVFIAPSTSGAANGYWDITWWHALAQHCRADAVG